ncbi:MAG: peptide-N-glycosidase F-related protein [Candidatus Cloacimonetes bacterium]|nr:peptide-N-glycosidase F-related protein [Candidatus Cloacimonadota bacterium]
MKKYFCILFLLSFCMYLLGVEFEYNFSDIEQNSKLLIRNYQGRLQPELMSSGILLIQGGRASNHNNAVIFPEIIENTYEIENYSFEMLISEGGEGAGFALINTDYISDDYYSFKTESWEKPRFANSFGLGIDIYNPKTSAWFDKYGNFYGREEREISLFWNQKEIYKLLSPVEFRSDPMEDSTSQFDLSIKYVTAGALISLAINDTSVVTDYFIPEMVQYEKRPVFGASTGDLTSTFALINFKANTVGEAPKIKENGRVTLLKDETFYAGRRNMFTQVDFKNVAKSSNKAIMTLDLQGAIGGLSTWDVGAAIYIVDKDSTMYEICRYITPYNRAYTWKIDVTDYLMLFNDIQTIYAKVDTWETVTDNPLAQKGWKVNAYIDFYSGNEKYIAFDINNIWSGFFEYGNPNKPLKDYLTEYRTKIPKNTKKAKLKVIVTGHGMSPNDDNAGEFRPSNRIITANDLSFENLLWKEDCYLNPCRPQDGTWKFDRAGWAPGDVVKAWEIDLTELISDKELILNYFPDDYVNTNIGEHFAPHHWIEAQLIFYK